MKEEDAGLPTANKHSRSCGLHFIVSFTWLFCAKYTFSEDKVNIDSVLKILAGLKRLQNGVNIGVIFLPFDVEPLLSQINTTSK